MDDFLKINIEMNISGDDLFFKIKNTYKEKKGQEGKGIGLDNIQKRLELLYPNQHQLEIKRRENWFIVELSIFKIKTYEKI